MPCLRASRWLGDTALKNSQLRTPFHLAHQAQPSGAIEVVVELAAVELPVTHEIRASRTGDRCRPVMTGDVVRMALRYSGAVTVSIVSAETYDRSGPKDVQALSSGPAGGTALLGFRTGEMSAAGSSRAGFAALMNCSVRRDAAPHRSCHDLPVADTALTERACAPSSVRVS